MEIRPHLRNCTACRATVRELYATTAPLAALFPVGLVPAAADHGHERTAGLLVRLYEAIAGGVHERAASAALKLQAATEAASTGKLAAIAASAAAIAGGGAAVVNGAGGGHRHHPIRAAQHTSAVTPAAVRTVASPVRSTAPVPARRARVRRTPHHEFPAARHRRRTTTTSRTEFATISTTASVPVAPTSTVVRSGSPEPSASSSEFSSEFGG
jgi:hypothetical protein